MDLSLFASQVIQTNGKSGAGVLSSNGLLGGANGLSGLSGADFLSIILGNLEEDNGDINTKTIVADNSKAKDIKLTPEQEKAQIKKETVDLALLQLALLGQDPDINLDEKIAELRVERQELAKSNRLEQLTKLINHLTNGLPEATGENANVEELIGRLTNRLEKLEAKLDNFRTGDFGDEGAPFKMLIATGLNPAQLTKITNRIEEVETKLGRELTTEDLIAGVGNIIPAPGDDDHEFSTTDALGLLLKNNKENNIEEETTIKNKNTKNEVESDNDISPENNDFDLIAAQLNNINVGGRKSLEDKTFSSNNSNVLNFLNNLPPMKSPHSFDPPLINKQKNVLNNATDANVEVGSKINTEVNSQVDGEIIESELTQQISNAEFKALFADTNNVNANIAKLKAVTVIQNIALPTLPNIGDISLPKNWNESFSAQASLSEALGFDIQTGTPFTSTMQAVHASASTNSPAGQTHPATQMVAAHITKAGKSGDVSRMTLQLDPPELGRVEIRLEFGKEKSVKAHMIVEKPETLVMLQRDASALERALQNAGLETDSGSLEYQMASDEYAFNSNGDGRGKNGQSNGNGSNSSNSGEEEIIETNITWNIDPATGHVRYNLLA